MTPLKILAMAIGFGGVIVVSAADVKLALNSPGECHLSLQASNITLSNRTLINNHSHIPAYGMSQRQCTPYTKNRVVFSLFALLGGSLMWSISSGLYNYMLNLLHKVIAEKRCSKIS